MKLYSQHGFADGEKCFAGLEQGYIDGIIYSPRDIGLDNLQKRLARLQKDFPKVDRLFDPQVYATFIAMQPDSRIGSLIDDYAQPSGYFLPRKRPHFESEKNIIAQLKSAFDFQSRLPLSAVIAPNIYISSSCDSIEAGISKQFIRLTKEIATNAGVKRPVYATLALSRNSLLNTQQLNEFLSDITVMDTPPDGFYILIGASKPDVRVEIYDREVIAAWMLINRTFAENGFAVINGYSDLVTPFLGIAGSAAGATGWWSNLRTFSLDRFGPPSGGGSLPIVRYLSNKLLGRITHFELQQLRDAMPDIMNGLPSDAFYPDDDEPERSNEVLQTWDTLHNLNTLMIKSDIRTNLGQAKTIIRTALDFRATIRSIMSLQTKSDGSHLEEIQQGISLFEKHAELA